MSVVDLDHLVRNAAFAYLAEQRDAHGDVLPRAVLERGFELDGQQIALISQRGIWKPAILPEMPLSICTTAVVEGKPRPYDDEVQPDGTIHYRYQGTDPAARDNVALRLAMSRRVPLVLFHGVVPGRFLALWPVYVIGDDPAALTFVVDVSRAAIPEDFESAGVHEDGPDLPKAYLTVQVRKRIHQHEFRERVLRAYSYVCAICRLRHSELLDAAHILPDKHPKGDPVVPNGLALCKLHHAAFDGNILGVHPDMKVEVRLDILEEIDGPMLLHGLQGFQGSPLRAPKSAAHRPDRERVAMRYEIFKKAC